MAFIVYLFIIYLLKTVSSEWAGANYTPNQLTTLPGYGQEWIYIPDENGDPQKIYLTPDLGLNNDTASIATNLTNRFFRKRTEELLNFLVTFDLYTKNQKRPHQLILNDVQRLRRSDINFSKEIKIITHGWLASNTSDVCQKIKDKYLEKKDVNVIIVDWAPLAKHILYIPSKSDTRHVGRHISKFIKFLVKNGAKLSNFHLIGHSLGAHVCGFAGAAIGNGRIRRITGLDPAKPFFQLLTGNNGRLDASDAEFVDIIHTCGGALGFSASLGTADFFPNGGTPSQPGCFGLAQIIEACSHSKAYQFFEQSIGNPAAYPSVYCKSWRKFKKGECDYDVIMPMGEEVSQTAHGDYYLITSHESPHHAINFDELFEPESTNTTDKSDEDEEYESEEFIWD